MGIEPTYIEHDTEQPFDGSIVSSKRILIYDVPQTAPLLRDLEERPDLDNGAKHYTYSEDGVIKLHYYKNVPLTKLARQSNRWKLDTNLILPPSFSDDRSYAPVVHGSIEGEPNTNYSWVVPFINYKEHTIDFPEGIPNIRDDLAIDFWKLDEAMMLPSHVHKSEYNIEFIFSELERIEAQLSTYTVDGGLYW